jgi:Uma2 family endonuclease
MADPARQRFSFDDYLTLEEDSIVKHEFLNGEAWAMAGGSPDHAAIAVNISTLLTVQLRGQPCRAYSSDLRIRVKATGLTTYPDVSVICGPPEIDPEDRKKQTATNPVVLVEVLSPSTEDYDRGEKLSQYQRIDSLQEIMLVAHDQRLVEVWRRSDGRWERHEFRGDAILRLESLACELPLTEVYRNPVPA